MQVSGCGSFVDEIHVIVLAGYRTTDPQTYIL
jgi:hypothetical protein